MRNFYYGHIQWTSLARTGVEDQQFHCLIQDSFLTQHVLESTSLQKLKLVDNVKTHEPLGNSDHNQIHFCIKVKSRSTNKKTYRRNFNKGKYKDMRKYLAKVNNMLRNKTAIECWKIQKYEIESIIDQFVPLKNKENDLENDTCQKKLFEK